ncbi:hypothetical protein, partial [Streptococcus pneumoniae]
GNLPDSGSWTCADGNAKCEHDDKKAPDESESASEEIFTVESYLSCCKETGLSIDDLKHISIGMALDYQTDYVNLRSEDKGGERKATQADFDSF